MEFKLWSFILDNLEAAGVIGGYVSLSIIGFALVSFAMRNRLNKATSHIGPKWTHPIVGSLLGIIPGCGATIIVASLFKNNKISFGGLLATFTSTLGEGSFVLLGASNEADVVGNLKAYFIITVFGLIAGIIFGLISDFYGFRINSKTEIQQKSKLKIQQKSNLELLIERIGFYSIILMAIFLAPGSIMAFWGGEIESISELTYWISIILTITCVCFYFSNKILNANHNECLNENNFKSKTLHAVLDVSMVITYVFIGLFIANFIIDIVIGPETFDSWMTSSSYIVILLAALIGAIPGCGGMIAVAVAYITIPNFPIAALIAAAIATSGDGIFPLIAANRKDGLILTGIGFTGALVVGYIAIILGF